MCTLLKRFLRIYSVFLQKERKLTWYNFFLEARLLRLCFILWVSRINKNLLSIFYKLKTMFWKKLIKWWLMKRIKKKILNKSTKRIKFRVQKLLKSRAGKIFRIELWIQKKNIRIISTQIDNKIISQNKEKVKWAIKETVSQTFLRTIELCLNVKRQMIQNPRLTLKNFFLKKSSSLITFS
jgi:hypothetical protein